MNQATISGRLTADPVIRTTGNGNAVAQFTVAVRRNFKNASGTYDSDFVPCVAWKQLADIVQKYAGKGMRVLCTGTIQTRTYNAQDGSKKFITELVISSIEVLDRKTDAQQTYAPAQTHAPVQQTESLDAFNEVDEDLPF